LLRDGYEIPREVSGAGVLKGAQASGERRRPEEDRGSLGEGIEPKL
jgi:hypothetical protein